MKKVIVFYLKIFSFFEVKFSMYLNRRVFVMSHKKPSLIFSEKKKNQTIVSYNFALQFKG